MVLIAINLVFFLLAAIPVYLYFRRCEDNVLSAILIALSALFIPSLYLAFSFTILAYFRGTYGIWVLTFAAPYLLHWVVWIRMAVKEELASMHVMPLLTVLILLLTYTVLFLNVLTLVLSLLYACAAAWLYRSSHRKRKNGEELSDAPLKGIFKEFAPQRILYVNENRKEYEEDLGK